MKIKNIYWAYSVVLLAEVLNLTFKLFNAYYFNLVVLFVLVLLTAVLGKSLGIKIGWVVTITVISLLLITLMTFIVWN